MGDNTLFARVDESLHSWEFITPIIESWKNKPIEEEELIETSCASLAIMDSLRTGQRIKL